jgi:hypothetical protein
VSHLPLRAFTTSPDRQHSAGTLPLTDTNPVDGTRGQQALNSLDYNPLLRATLVRVDEWKTGEKDPLPSRYSRLADGTAVAPEQAKGVSAAAFRRTRRRRSVSISARRPRAGSRRPCRRLRANAVDRDGNEGAAFACLL